MDHETNVVAVIDQHRLGRNRQHALPPRHRDLHFRTHPGLEALRYVLELHDSLEILHVRSPVDVIIGETDVTCPSIARLPIPST